MNSRRLLFCLQVTTFVADYVLDDNGCLWLVRALDPILAVSKTKFGLYAACPEQQSRAGAETWRAAPSAAVAVMRSCVAQHSTRRRTRPRVH